MNPDQQQGFGPPGDFPRRDFAPMQLVGHDGGHGWHWVFPLLILLVLTAMLAWMVVQSRRRPTSAAGPVSPTDHALTELRLRYARGEVTREEFLATEADLRGIAPFPRPPEPPAAPPAAA